MEKTYKGKDNLDYCIECGQLNHKQDKEIHEMTPEEVEEILCGNEDWEKEFDKQYKERGVFNDEEVIKDFLKGFIKQLLLEKDQEWRIRISKLTSEFAKDKEIFLEDKEKDYDKIFEIKDKEHKKAMEEKNNEFVKILNKKLIS